MSTVERRAQPRTHHDEPGRHLVTWSWLVLLALPLSFAAGFVAAHLPYAFTDWQETDPTPLWFALLVAVLGIGVTWLPVGVSGVLARRALFAGRTGAWAPLLVDVLLTLAALSWIVISV
ncbi:hypothetical protein ACFUC1_19440 [Pedococcus sp. NPDC057267]|uniref:hypothetical protein n=1 Tax=Pedococcus sp. NPDC057267 TaxID=3346077 RepID=UPI00362A9D96